MNIVVKKATILNSLFLKYEFEQSNINSNDNITASSDAAIHDDLRNAFRQLIPHFAFICEEVLDESLVEAALERPESYLEDQENAASDVFFKYRVTSFQIKGKAENEKITISGAKRLGNGEEIYFTTPEMFVEPGGYQFSMQFIDNIQKLREEVQAYMEGKQAPKAQLEMFGEDQEESNDDDAI